MGNQKQKIEGLNGLRALAALTVVATHMGWYETFSESGIFPMVHGWAGVQLFFVLSGFLITRLLLLEREHSGAIHLTYFFLRRAFRILPLYFIILLLVILITLFIAPKTEKEGFLMAALNVYNYVPRAWYSSTLGHLWSLGVEEHFYLFWPFFLLWLWNRTSRTQAALLGSILALSVLAYPATFAMPELETLFFTERWTTSVAYNLLFGSLGAIILCSNDWPQRYRSLTRNLLTKPFALAASVLLWGHTLLFDSEYISDLLRGVGFSLLVMWIFCNQQSRVVKILSIPPLDYIGKVSYGIYMYQGIIITTGPLRNPDSAWPPSPGIGLIIVLIIVPISYHLIERPLLRFGSRFRAA